jgi:tetratricopeptide (TPR) repeat protein
MIKINQNAMALFTALLISVQNASSQTLEAINFNNEGVAALKNEEWKDAICKFEAALRADGSDSLARQNLAIAHNDLALYLLWKKHKPKEALKELHQALFIDSKNKTTIGNANEIIKKMGKNPNNFADRVSLGDQARRENDIISAIVEYKVALAIKRDSKTHKKLDEVSRLSPKTGNFGTTSEVIRKK